MGTRRVSAGAKLAVTTRPAVRSRAPAASASTSAKRGPMRTRRRLPAGATEAMGATMRLAVPPSSAASMRTSQGCTTAPTGPSGPAGAWITPPPSSTTSARPFAPGRAIAGSRLLPTKLATKASAGAASRPAGVSIWRIRPRTITPTRSARAEASSKSCVTSSAGRRSSCSRPNSSARTRARVWASSADSGSSNRRAAGSLASARARPTRWRSPPDSCRGRAPARWAMPNRSSSSSARAAPAKATFWRTVMCGKSAYSWKT